MKKFLALVLGVLFVLSFAASAFAIHAEIPSETQAVVSAQDIQITLGGEIRVRGWYLNNINDAKEPSNTLSEGGKSHSNAYYDERVRLSIDAKVAPGVEGFVMLENSDTNFNNATDSYKWGSVPFTTSIAGSSLNSKPGTGLYFNEAWILYSGSGLLSFPAGVKVGHMPLALGEKQFFDHTKFGDDAIVFFMDPVKPLHVAFLTFKGADFSSAANGNSEDLDAYVALFTYKLDDKNTVGMNYTYLNEPNPGLFDNLKLQDLSIHANGNIAGLGYKAEGDIQFGSAGDPKSDFKGFAAMLGLNYNVNPANIRASFAYGSGGKSTDSDTKEFQTFVSSNPLNAGSNDQHYTLVYEYQVVSAANEQITNGVGTGIANTTYFNLGVDYAATKDLNASLDGYILRASKTDSGVSKNIGWEVDAKIAYQLAKNLTYQIDAGYLKAGNFYRDTNSSFEKSSATVLRHAVTLSF